ncbi:MAG: lipoprotein [Dokdonella sp.]
MVPSITVATVNGGYTACTPLPDFVMSPHFHRRRTLVLRQTFAFALVALLLAACGNKGNLVKPTPKDSPAPASIAPPASH